MPDLLQYVGLTVGAMDVHIFRRIVDESFVTGRPEFLPGIYQREDGIAMGTCLDVEVARVEPAAGGEAGYPL